MMAISSSSSIRSIRELKTRIEPSPHANAFNVDHQVDLEVQRQPLGVGVMPSVRRLRRIMYSLSSSRRGLLASIHSTDSRLRRAMSASLSVIRRGGVRRGVEQFAGVDLPASDLELCFGRTGTYDAQQYGRDKNEFGFIAFGFYARFSGCKFNANCGRLSARCRLFVRRSLSP